VLRMGSPAPPQREPKRKPTIEELKTNYGLEFLESPCPKCGAPTRYKKRAPCWLRAKRFAFALRCLACGNQEGYRGA
jgi:predicted amidophosphoribosyltransferase